MGLGGGWDADAQLTTDHERQAREFVDASGEIGANFFDHANIYGRGRAEEVPLNRRGWTGNHTPKEATTTSTVGTISICRRSWMTPGTPRRYFRQT